MGLYASIIWHASLFFITSKQLENEKIMVNAVIAVSLGAMTLSSCIGSFGLTNKVLDWNKGATDNKFINELIFLVISPAYAVCSVADLFVLNTIEFWTGDKVVANVGKTKNVTGKDGRLYAIKTLKNGYEITDPEGEKSYFVFDKKNKSWSYSKDGDIRELFSFNEDGSIQACLPSGEKMNVSADEYGLYQVRMAMNGGLYFAMNK